MTGLARAQTARLNVARVDELPPPDIDMPPCMVGLAFLDEMGMPIMDRAGMDVAMTGMLEPGEAAFLDLPAADAFIGNPDTRRRQFRARTAVLPPPDINMPAPDGDFNLPPPHE